MPKELEKKKERFQRSENALRLLKHFLPIMETGIDRLAKLLVGRVLL
jgi:hypothetical protein